MNRINMVVQTWIVIIFGIFFMNLQYFTLYKVETFFIILLATQGSCALKSIVNISPPNNFDPATPLHTDERTHRSCELTTFIVLFDLNNVFSNRLCAFDILRCGSYPLEFRLVNKW